MKCLVVTAHPLTQSLCKQLTDHIVEALAKANHEVTVEDLYAQQFSPQLTPTERESYYQDRYDTSAISEYVEHLQKTELLVLLFPTWWFSFPAVLKGWFDRVWGPGIAYDHANDYGQITPRLTNLKKVLVITSLGSPWWVDRFIMRQPVKRIIKTALLNTCAKQSTLQFLSLYNSEKLSLAQINKFKRKINRALHKWK